ncbi:MAG: hypothetical protein RIS64_1 [Bacteroidota bacterium]|jgi:hypothetical protein
MKAKIIDYLENELSPQDKIAFEQALTTDTDLQKAYIFQKAQWEKLSLLRFNAKAATLLNAYESVKDGDSYGMTTQTAIIKPMPYAFMTVRRARYAALAAATLLFLFNYNSLINLIKPTSTQTPAVVTTKPVEPTPSVEPVIPVSPMPSVAPAMPVAPNPAATVAVPKQPKSKLTPAATPKSTPFHTTPEARMEMAVVIKGPGIVGSGKSDDSIFLSTQPKKDTLTSKMLIDGSTVSLDNMYDFKGTNGLIFKHLSKINCNNYTVSFVIKADGTVEQPKLEKGDKNCEALLLNQIKTMPLLKKPIFNEKSVDYRYFFTKD